jgi:hypothetical protein
LPEEKHRVGKEASIWRSKSMSMRRFEHLRFASLVARVNSWVCCR